MNMKPQEFGTAAAQASITGRCSFVLDDGSTIEAAESRSIPSLMFGAADIYVGQCDDSAQPEVEYGSAADAAPKQTASGSAPWGRLRGIGSAILRFARYLLRQHEIRRAANDLMYLDDRALRDIGLHRSQIGYAVRHGRDIHPWR